MEDRILLSIIEPAIQKEQDSYDFYLDLHGRVDDPFAKETLIFVAGEEKKHKEFLINYRNGRYGPASLPMTQTVDYKIAEYLAKPDLEKNMLSKDVYLVAAHRELQSYNLYRDLAKIQPAGEARELLLRMAGEELGHKEKMEYLYANTAFPQTSGG